MYLLKLRQDFSEIQDTVRIQRVIWDHLLAFKGEIIQKQALFSLPCRTPNNSRVVLIYAVCSVFSFVLFSTPPKSFFRVNHVRKSWNRCFHSRFSFEAIILGFFFTETSACVGVGDRGYFVESSNDAR